jgi:hypothetical protein
MLVAVALIDQDATSHLSDKLELKGFGIGPVGVTVEDVLSGHFDSQAQKRQ